MKAKIITNAHFLECNILIIPIVMFAEIFAIMKNT